MKATHNPESLLLSPREAAKFLGLSERFVWELTKRGELPSFKLGRLTRYSREVLQHWAATRSGVS